MENQENKKSDEIKISKKSLIVGGSIVLLLGLGGAYFVFNKDKNPQENKPKTDSLVAKKDSTITLKTDSLQNEREYEGEDESPYAEYRVIAKEIVLPTGQKLKFGDVIYKDWERSNSNNSVVYLHNPTEAPSTKSNPIQLNEEVIIDSYSFPNFQNKFSLSPYSSLLPSVKKLLMSEEGYKGDYKFYITQNADRAKATLAMGDFDSDGIKDVAVVLDDNEKQMSRLLIIAFNKVTKEPYVAYAETYSDKLRLRSFAKGASIYMDSSEFVKAPRDGVIISNEYGGTVIIYDSKSQKFKSYDQTPTIYSGVEEEEG